MGIYLNPQGIDFEEALNSEIYIDKSELIKYTNKVLRTKQKYICVSRPRRFGKSMAAEMLTAYYSCGCDSIVIIENFFNYKDVVELFKIHNTKNNIQFILISRTSIYKNQYETLQMKWLHLPTTLIDLMKMKRQIW